jgi:hypothetical protein
MDEQRCFKCGEDKPVMYEAVFTPSEGGGTPRHLVVCEDCGRSLDAEAFARLAMAELPSAGGAVELVNHPSDQVARDGKLPENQ